VPVRNQPVGTDIELAILFAYHPSLKSAKCDVGLEAGRVAR
jgi:hypothetical protein